MNTLEKRERIKFILSKLTDGNRNVFRLIYNQFSSEKNEVNQIVDDIPDPKVGWALTQCENTYHKIFKILKNG